MKWTFTFFLIFLLMTFSKNAHCQSIDNDSSQVTITPMNRAQLARYRRFIWDSLPIAVGWVNDFEGLFSNKEEVTLETMIQHFEKSTGIEIMIVTIDTNMVAKGDFKDFSYRLLRIWGIGKRLKENGIIICISSGYQILKVSCDFGIDKLMSESTTTRIENKYFIPAYKKNKYYEGTYKGLVAIITQLSKKLKSVEGKDVAS
jgi:uncharacterized protein